MYPNAGQFVHPCNVEFNRNLANMIGGCHATVTPIGMALDLPKH
jgi:hypothetical protein